MRTTHSSNTSYVITYLVKWEGSQNRYSLFTQKPIRLTTYNRQLKENCQLKNEKRMKKMQLIDLKKGGQQLESDSRKRKFTTPVKWIRVMFFFFFLLYLPSKTCRRF